MDITAEELKARSAKLEQYYQQGISEIAGCHAKIHIIMLRYGISNVELRENYHLLRTIEESMDRTERYQVAFDITHSFRSLPIYNLVILNYLKNISHISLEIRHVYYGNIEIARENNGIAPIVDLKELIDVMDLSIGASEFKNTGNAVTLLHYIPDSERNLKDALEKFDWATQSNFYNEVVDSLTNLLRLTQSLHSDQSNKYTSLREMIFQVIQYKFFDVKDGHFITADEFQSMPLDQKQFLLSNWYFNQNRYGQAVVTAIESLKSTLAVFYLQFRGLEVTLENIREDEYRQISLKRLANICTQFPDNRYERSEAENLLYDLNQTYKKANWVRNNFSHNLNDHHTNTTTDRTHPIQHRRSQETHVEPRNIIHRFICKLRDFRNYISTYRAEIENIYQKESIFPSKISSTGQIRSAGNENSEDKLRLIIAPPSETIDYISYLQSPKGEMFKVYHLSKEEALQVYNEKSVEDAALYLVAYIQQLYHNHSFNLKKTEIIFRNLTMKQIMYFAPLLYSLDVQKINHEVNGEKKTLPGKWLNINMRLYQKKIHEIQKSLQIQIEEALP